MGFTSKNLSGFIVNVQKKKKNLIMLAEGRGKCSLWNISKVYSQGEKNLLEIYPIWGKGVLPIPSCSSFLEKSILNRGHSSGNRCRMLKPMKRVRDRNRFGGNYSTRDTIVKIIFAVTIGDQGFKLPWCPCFCVSLCFSALGFPKYSCSWRVWILQPFQLYTVVHELCYCRGKLWAVRRGGLL